MSEKCSHEGHRERLRQRYIDASLDAFADHEVIELLLTYSIPRLRFLQRGSGRIRG